MVWLVILEPKQIENKHPSPERALSHSEAATPPREKLELHGIVISEIRYQTQ
jgi:hypothetical protein